MRTKISLLLAGIIIALLSSGCTRNNGDIGDLFGWWTLDSLRADGSEQALTADDVLIYTFTFQASIVQVQQTLDHAEFHRYKGTWERRDNLLLLNFGHSDTAGGWYTPPAELHLIRGITPMTIVELTHSKMHLRYTNDDDGVTYDYYLSKAI